MNFYISDMHFGHTNIIKHCQRPFDTVEAMDEVMINNWNQAVKNDDTVYILGDIAFSKAAKKASHYLQLLNGNKYIILGNHDQDIRKNRSEYIRRGIVKDVSPYMEITDTFRGKNQRIVLFHYPITEWNNYFRGSIHLYGHVHNNTENQSYQIMKGINGAFNVSADILDFTPRTLDEIVSFNKKFFS